MTEAEHLLVCLMEEAAEIQKACAKALRFGLDDTYRRDHEALPADTPEWKITPRAEIQHELNDFMGVLHLLRDRGVLPSRTATDDAAAWAKVRKVQTLMIYARSQGTLDKEPT